MTVERTALLDRYGYTTHAQQLGAVGTWLSASLRNGAWPIERWDATLAATAASAADAAKPNDRGLDDGWPAARLRTSGHWRVNSDNSNHRFLTLIAETGDAHLEGRAAVDSLQHIVSGSTRVRVTTFTVPTAGATPDRKVLASIADNGGLHLFDPGRGIYRYRVTPGSRPYLWFASHLTKHFGPKIEGFTTYAIDTVDAYLTWFGPPQQKPMAQRIDITGATSLAGAPLAPTHYRPRLKLCCLGEYADEFRQQLTGHPVEILPIETLLPTVNRAGAAAGAAEPDPSDVAATTAFTMSRLLGRGVEYYAFAKDLWSLYCIYRYGGFHLDSGVQATDGQGPTTWHLPTERQPWIMAGIQPGSPIVGHPLAQHLKGPFGRSGLACIAPRDPLHALGLLWPSRRGGQPTARKDTLPRAPHIDVPLLGAPRHHPAMLRAVQCYLYLDQLARQAGIAQGDSLKDIYRAVILTAAATGLTHPHPNDANCTPGSRDYTASVVRLEDLGLYKVGGGSHRQPAPGPAGGPN